MKQWVVRCGRFQVVGVLVGLFFVVPAGNAGERLTLKACVERALAHNFTLRSYVQERQAVAMEVKEALAPFYPSLSFGTSFDRSDSQNAPRSDSTHYDFRADYTLFKGGRDVFSLRAKRHEYKASDYDLQEESLRVVAEVEKTYFALLSLRNRLEVLKKSVEAAALHEKVARKRVEAELAPRSDHLRAKVDLANARVDLVQARRNVKTLENALSVLMGLPPNGTFSLAKEPMRIEAGKKTLSELFFLARKYRPVLKSYEEQIRKLTWEKKALKSEFSPSLNVYAEAGERGSYFMPNEDYWSIGISLEYPFFSGFSTHYAVARMRARLASERWSFKQKILEVQKEIADAYAQLRSDERVIEARRTLLESAEENLKIAQRRYEVGVGSIVELTDARVEATDAAIGLEEAKLTVMGDEIELKRFTGWFVPKIREKKGEENGAKTNP